MAITEAARRNHEELFPSHESTLKVSDPEGGPHKRRPAGSTSWVLFA